MTVSEVIGIDSMEKAADILARAKNLEQSAAEYRKAAREYILREFTEPDEGWYADPQGTKTWLRDTDAGTVAVTQPESRPVPAHFDHERTDEFYVAVEDLFPEAVTLAFNTRIIREFSPEGYLAAARQQPHLAERMHDLIEKFTVPASDGKPLSPRVEVRD